MTQAEAGDGRLPIFFVRHLPGIRAVSVASAA
jgi:hypothetical protein